MKKINIAAVLLLSLVLVFAGCSNASPGASASPSVSAEASASPSASADPAKTINVAGSDYVASLIDELAQKYMDANTDIEIFVTESNSNLGIAALAEGDVNIAASSRALKDAEKTVFPGMKEAVLCTDGIAVIVNADCPVTSLTLKQVKDIFTGEITDWKDLGAEAGDIAVYTMNSDSEVRKAFNSLFLGTDEKGQIIDTDDYLASAAESGEEVISAVLDDKNAIGYVPLSEVEQGTVKALQIDGAAASAAGVKDGSYPYALNYILVTLSPSAETQAFFEYCTGSEASSIITGKGLIK